MLRWLQSLFRRRPVLPPLPVAVKVPRGGPTSQVPWSHIRWLPDSGRPRPMRDNLGNEPPEGDDS